MDDWQLTLTEIETATGRLLATLGGLADEDMRAPSLLPGWSRGLLTTHIARNADSLWRLLEWARTGQEIPQYESLDARNAELDAGAGRPAAVLRADALDSAERFAAQARTLPESAWTATVRAMTGFEHPAWYVLNRRWREVEAHHVDLRAGYDHTDWPEPYVRWELSDTLAGLRAHGGLTVARVRATDLEVDVRLGEDGPFVEGPARDVLGWLSGRTDGKGLGDDLPVPPSWPRPAAL